MRPAVFILVLSCISSTNLQVPSRAIDPVVRGPEKRVTVGDQGPQTGEPSYGYNTARAYVEHAPSKVEGTPFCLLRSGVDSSATCTAMAKAGYKIENTKEGAG